MGVPLSVLACLSVLSLVQLLFRPLCERDTRDIASIIQVTRGHPSKLSIPSGSYNLSVPSPAMTPELCHTDGHWGHGPVSEGLVL